MGAASPKTQAAPGSPQTPRRGVLFLVVGPSGVGKDSLIDLVRARRPDILFPKRLITRPADAGGEAHEAMTPEAFHALEGAGGMALSWRAHDLAYGVPIVAAEALAEGRSVLVNISRQVIDQARARYRPVLVLSITAPPQVLAARLAARGRETAEDIEQRLRRAARGAPSGPDVAEIANDGALEDAAAAMLAAIDAATAASRSAQNAGGS